MENALTMGKHLTDEELDVIRAGRKDAPGDVHRRLVDAVVQQEVRLVVSPAPAQPSPSAGQLRTAQPQPSLAPAQPSVSAAPAQPSPGPALPQRFICNGAFLAKS